MRLNDYDDFIEYVLDEFEIEDDITVVCDYKLADILNYYFGDEEYCEYKGINLQSDINEYYVTKFGKDFFCITPIKYDEKIKITTGDYFIIDNNILEDNPTLFNYLEGNNFKVEIIYYDEDSCEDGKEKCNWDYNYIRCTLEDAKFNSAYIADYTMEHDAEEEDICYLELADLIEEYTGLILDNDCKEEVLGHALTEFAGRIFENFCLEITEE
ncbi:hypothetical protein [Clostridium botulinum]|uniref:hypothetical protein n=1 Tax=Clostridium botulinum TaxID=1491 RepID=UPI002204A78C|nr:hypothetical protein [Clostridium botulinum]QDY27197.1 hypothetical protein CGQ40_21055 [Clostridium botulinum]